MLDKQIPDRIGLFEHFWPETLRECWPKQGYPEDTGPAEFFDYDLRGAGGWLDTVPFRGVHEVIDETDEWQVARDGRGAILKHWKHKSGTPEHIGFTVTDPQTWADYREPLLELDRTRYNAEAIKNGLHSARQADKFSFFGILGFVELLRATLGDMVWLPSLLIEKNWIHDINRVYLDFFISHYGAIFDEVGLPDGFWLYEDVGYTNGLWCSPNTMREMFLPYYAELVDFMKGYNLQVLLHTCGDVREAVSMIIEAGFDCLQPMEAKVGNDVLEFAREYGCQLCYMGNMDVTVLNTNDKEKVRDEVVRKVTALKDLGVPYIFHSDHSIPPDIEFETYQYAVDLAREYGEY